MFSSQRFQFQSRHRTLGRRSSCEQERLHSDPLCGHLQGTGGKAEPGLAGSDGVVRDGEDGAGMASRNVARLRRPWCWDREELVSRDATVVRPGLAFQLQTHMGILPSPTVPVRLLSYTPG